MARNQTAWLGAPGRGRSGFSGSTERNSMALGERRASETRGGTGLASEIHRSWSSVDGVSASAGGTSGIGEACSSPASGAWNEAIIERMRHPCWIACTRRAESSFRRERAPPGR